MLRTFIFFSVAAATSTILIFFLLTNVTWHSIPQLVGFGEVVEPSQEEIDNGLDGLSDLRTMSQPMNPTPSGSKGNADSTEDWQSPYSHGQVKPPGSKYTRTLVVPRLSKENVSWYHEELGDMIEDGQIRTVFYSVDDRKAPLRPPKNKGHEAMTYLSYIIDHYDNLTDINIFLHAHRWAWHNNQAQNLDSADMLRRLSPERVTREGYMNLRCHWDPGCPAWIHPGSTIYHTEKHEEILIAKAWAELFPQDAIPLVLSQPCCAQFAVSKDRIRAHPKSRYLAMRNWLLQTRLSDNMSGRVFEYTWQFIFTGRPEVCPSMNECYCDGYGICFGSDDAFAAWLELAGKQRALNDEKWTWDRKVEAIKVAQEAHTDTSKLEQPEPGRDVLLQQELEKLVHEMQRVTDEAIERGKDPRERAKASNRSWEEGDGF